MIAKLWLGLALVVAVVESSLAIAARPAPEPREVIYEHFDDYLLSIPLEDRDGADRRENSTQTETDPGAPGGVQSTITATDILGYFRDVPREHWSCCMLGKLAGDKGYHCHAQFYQARIVLRNTNRAHNRKMHFHGPDRIPNYGRQTMHTFERCVSRHSADFHKCCYAAAIERRERRRWQEYRDHSGHQEAREEERRPVNERQRRRRRQRARHQE